MYTNEKKEDHYSDLIQIKYYTDIRPQNQPICMPLRNNTKMSAQFFKELPLLSTSSSWVWLAPFTTLAHWIIPGSWVLVLREFRSLSPSFRCILSTTLLNLSIPGVPFSVLLSTLIRSRFQAKPATLLIPIEFPFLFAVEELYGTRYQSGSFSLINVGSGFHCLRSFFSFLFFSRYIENLLR